MAQPVLIHRSRRHLGLALTCAVIGPLMIAYSLFATGESIIMRVLALPVGVGFLVAAWPIFREIFGARPVIKLDARGMHYRETVISFYFPWHEISAVSHREVNNKDAVLVHLTAENYDLFCSRLPKWAQGLFRVHGRSPGLFKLLAVGINVLELSPRPLDIAKTAIEIGSDVLERTIPRYAVVLPIINLQVSAAELESILLRFLNAR